MIDEIFSQSLGIIIVTGALFALAARPLKMPTIVAYLLAGLVLGPVTHLVEITHALELISQVGIILLLFLVGLELSLDNIRGLGKVAALAGIGQVIFTALGGFLLCWMLGFTIMESVFLSTALTFSSTVVVVKLLDEKKEINSLYGRIAVGIFLVQDLVAVFILTLLAGFGSQEAMGAQALTGALLKAFGGMAALLLLVTLASRYGLPRPFAWASRSPETLFIWSLCWCFLIVLAAQFLGLSLEIGGFLAGFSLAQLPYNQDLRRRVHPLMNFFIAVFFVSLGIEMELGAALDHWAAGVILSLFVLIGNPLIFMWIISAVGYSERTSFLTSVTVAQISEFSFIFVAMGLKSNLIGQSILSLTALVGVITIGISAYMILYNHPLYRLARRLGLLKPFRAGQLEEPHPELHRQGHVIVVGMNSLGRKIVQELCARGEKVLAIDRDPKKMTDLPCETLLGNAEHLSLLEEAELPHAKLLVSALQIEETNDLLAYRCHSYNIPCSISVVDLSVMENLLEMDVTYLMIPKVDGIKAQNRELKKLGYLSA